MMRKKELIRKIQELIDSVETLHRENELYKKENEELKAELELLKQNVTQEDNFCITEGFKVADEEESQDEQEDKNETVVIADQAMEYGSLIIGKIVVESARYANEISASTSENKKELLNLIMGKAEVAKAEIYSISTGSAPTQTKKDLIDGELSSSLDYFKSVIGQI
ncbi:MAG: hypothetical protein J6Q56_02740 [Clostridia bacterium]|nr:hypothetical protein [Clostridia bacterium]